MLLLGSDQTVLQHEVEAALRMRKGLFFVWSCRLFLSAAALCTFRAHSLVCGVWQPWSQKHTKLFLHPRTLEADLHWACRGLVRCPASVQLCPPPDPGIAVRDRERASAKGRVAERPKDSLLKVCLHT